MDYDLQYDLNNLLSVNLENSKRDGNLMKMYLNFLNNKIKGIGNKKYIKEHIFYVQQKI